MIFDVLLILLLTAATFCTALKLGQVLGADKKEEEKECEGWAGILNYDHRKGGGEKK